MKDRHGDPRCYATVATSEDEGAMEAAAIARARRLWPEGELRIDRVYPCGPGYVMYEVVPGGGE